MFALGRYAGARRRAIVAMKDRGRADLRAPLARSLALGVHRLLRWGLLDVPLTIVPAPTRGWSARHRGGDPVTRIAALATAGHPDITVVRALRMTALARDSAGLNSAARERNIAGRVLLTRRRLPAGGELLLVDDIVTTGATARESVRVLQPGRGTSVGCAGASGGMSVCEELATGRAKCWQCRPWTVYRRESSTNNASRQRI